MPSNRSTRITKNKRNIKSTKNTKDKRVMERERSAAHGGTHLRADREGVVVGAVELALALALAVCSEVKNAHLSAK